MDWELLKNIWEKTGMPLVQSFGGAFFAWCFNKRKKTDNNIEKPNNVTNVFNITITNNYYNNPELPK